MVSASPVIDAALIEIDRRVRATLRDLHRARSRKQIAAYDRERCLPQALFGLHYDADDVRSLMDTPRPTIIRALRNTIRHLRELHREHKWIDVVPQLRDARAAYRAERLAALRDRRQAAQFLRDARAA